jgi:hypothetical protein
MKEILSLVREILERKITDQDKMQKPKIYTTTSISNLAADEEHFGFQLPPLLKVLYCEIGNGGFGPGYGLIGMSSGAPDDTGKTALEIYEQLRKGDADNPACNWPAGLLPICHWGCAILSCIDCADEKFSVRIFDPNIVGDSRMWDGSFFEEAASFDAWMTAWAEGRDIWNQTYGDSGTITLSLSQRKVPR